MIETIVIHAAWWLFGFMCGACAMGALAMSSTLSRMEETPLLAPEADEPKPAENTELAEAKETSAFYQALYAESMNPKT